MLARFTRFALTCLAAAALASVASATPPPYVPLTKAVEQADYVGVIEIAESPTGKKFRASAPPVVAAKPVAVLKGEAKGNVRFAWQTHFPCCLPQDPNTVEVIPPGVGEQYMVFLVKGKDGGLTPMGYQWNLHKMPAAPTVRLQPSHDNAWRGLIEVSPAVAGRGEAVRYRFTRTRLAEQPWTGNDSNLIAEDIDVIDLTRKQVLDLKNPGVRKTAPAVVNKGETVVDEINLTEAFGITKPGEYWVFRGGAFEGNAPLRFEVTDKLRKR
jgi:hypothetical protein